MRHYEALEDVNLGNSWLTIGSFDGVHRGHQEIVRKLTAGAHTENLPSVVITFHPHPSVVLGKRLDPAYLTTPRERADLLGELGVDMVITHVFNQQVASTSARDFIARLKRYLGFSHLLVGPDFALGKDREGDIPALERLGNEFGYHLQVIPPAKVGDEIVSSSKIRAALAAGEVERAAQLLGRPYQLSGEVVPGDGRGRTIGIPTANLRVWSERALPASGVYVCQAHLNTGDWGAVANVGFRPTFNPQTDYPQVETHLLDFEGQLYGEQVRLDFLQRLRDERRFPSITALVDQILQDISKARTTLSQLTT